MTDEKKHNDDELSEGQLDDISGGLTEPMIGSLPGGVVEPQNQLDVSGVGETYEALYYVDDVEHSFDTTGYKPPFKLDRNQTG